MALSPGDLAVRPWLVLLGGPEARVSELASALGAQAGRPVRDVTSELEQASGASLGEQLGELGEEAYRARERDACLKALGTAPGAVVALPSGAVLAADVRAVLQGAVVVHLRVETATLARRAGLARGVAGVTGGVNATLRRLHRERAVLYQQVATIQLEDRDHASVASLVDELRSQLGRP